MSKINKIVGLGQLNPVPLDVDTNLINIEKLVQQAAKAKKKLLILPKNSLLGQIDRNLYSLLSLDNLISEAVSKLSVSLPPDLTVLIANDKPHIYDVNYFLLKKDGIISLQDGDAFHLGGYTFFLNSSDISTPLQYNIVLENLFFADQGTIAMYIADMQIRSKNTIVLSSHGLVDGQFIYTGLAFISTNGHFDAFGRLFSYRSYNLVDDCVDTLIFNKSDKTEFLNTIEALAFGLYDYLQKGKSKGYVISLSGGADSSLCSVLVCASQLYALNELGFEEYRKALQNCGIDIGAKQTGSAASFIREKVMKHVLTTVYQSTENNSDSTFKAANTLAEDIGSSHHNLSISAIISSYTDAINETMDKKLSWDKNDRTLQNIQARVRGPSAWMFANKEDKLLIATSNFSELTVGYFTMDGDSVGGIAPLGGIFKTKVLHLNRYLEKHGLEASNDDSTITLKGLALVNKLDPSAELRPGGKQTDEDDLMPYADLDFIAQSLYSGTLEQVLREEKDMKKRQYYFDCAKKVLRLYTTSQWKRYRAAKSFFANTYTNSPLVPVVSDQFGCYLKSLKSTLHLK